MKLTKVNVMSYCPKCGTKVDEEMAFCPKCGAPLKSEQPPSEAKPVAAHYRAEKHEKQEKREKEEKHEKHEKEEKGETSEKFEKREFGILGPLIGGLILVFLGLMSFLQVTGYLEREIAWAFFFVIIGIIIIIGAVYAARRHPKP